MYLTIHSVVLERFTRAEMKMTSAKNLHGMNFQGIRLPLVSVKCGK